MFPRYSAYVIPNTFLDLLVNKVTPPFRTKDDVVEKLGVSVCHPLSIHSSTADAAEIAVIPDRGLKATAKCVGPLRGGHPHMKFTTLIFCTRQGRPS